MQGWGVDEVQHVMHKQPRAEAGLSFTSLGDPPESADLCPGADQIRCIFDQLYCLQVRRSLADDGPAADLGSSAQVDNLITSYRASWDSLRAANSASMWDFTLRASRIQASTWVPLEPRGSWVRRSVKVYSPLASQTGMTSDAMS